MTIGNTLEQIIVRIVSPRSFHLCKGEGRDTVDAVQTLKYGGTHGLVRQQKLSG